MFSPATMIALICLYMAVMFTVGVWVERRAAKGHNISNNRLVYALALDVYFTTWTVYGMAGSAAKKGLLGLTPLLGGLFAICIWWPVLRKMIGIRRVFATTSIADFISTRYGKSRFVAALVSLIALLGAVPYVALQLKAIFGSINVISRDASGTPAMTGDAPLALIAVLLVVFTVAFGARRLNPTQRHQGLVFTVAIESALKLAAFIAVGLFCLYGLYDGFGDFTAHISSATMPRFSNIVEGSRAKTFLNWNTTLIASMCAVMFLPRQFHVSVVENFDLDHARTAPWLLGLYCVLTSFFTLPIAMAGLAHYPVAQGDMFALLLPLEHGAPWLAVFLFIGGFAAGAGMIMVSAVTVSTMVTNHLVLPLIEGFPPLSFLRRYVLQMRWLAIACFIGFGFAFERTLGTSSFLASMGMISFLAILQFAPAMTAALYWRHANRTGAMIGMTSGFAMWFYTLIIPAVAKSGWISTAWLDVGPFGIDLLRCQALLGMRGVDPISHAFFWTLLVNIGGLVVGSMLTEQSDEERDIAEKFVSAGVVEERAELDLSLPQSVSLAPKRQLMVQILRRYFAPDKAETMAAEVIARHKLTDRQSVTVLELLNLRAGLEGALGAAIGQASAHWAVNEAQLVNAAERQELTGAYSQILGNLRLTPEELQQRISHYQERENKLVQQAVNLENVVEERTRLLKETQNALMRLERSALERQMAGGFAHEMRNSLSAAKNVLSVMLGNDGPVPAPSMPTEISTSAAAMREMVGRDHAGLSKLQERLEEVGTTAGQMNDLLLEVNQAVERAIRITAEILHYSQLGRVVAGAEEVDVTQILQGIIIESKRELGNKNIQVDGELATGVRSVVDASHLYSIVKNVVSNARDAFVGVPNASAKNVHVTLKQEGERLLVTIRDNGTGIPENIKERIFEPFFSTKPSTGIGLGLSVVKKMVELYDGDLRFESEQGRGTTFYITMPIKKAQQATAAKQN